MRIYQIHYWTETTPLRQFPTPRSVSAAAPSDPQQESETLTETHKLFYLRCLLIFASFSASSS